MKAPPLLTDVQAAYLAGLVDGEGSIYAKRRLGRGLHSGYTYAPHLRIAMATSEPLRTIAIWLHRTRPLNSRLWASGRMWDLDIARVELVLKVIRPFLVLKQQQADIALRMFQLQRGRQRGQGVWAYPALVRAEMFQLHQQLRALHGREKPPLAASVDVLPKDRQLTLEVM